jgi:hypothetical protein
MVGLFQGNLGNKHLPVELHQSEIGQGTIVPEQKVPILIKRSMLLEGISGYLLLSPKWEGISGSIQ